MGDTRASDWEDFESVLNSLVAVVDDLPQNAQEFIEGMQERFEKYGEDCYVTERQWEWMQKLAKDYA